jgi:hypothetical protein
MMMMMTTTMMMNDSGQYHDLADFTPGKEIRYLLNKRLGGTKSRSASVRKAKKKKKKKKTLFLPGFEPWTIQPVASRCTDYANSAPNNFHKRLNIRELRRLNEPSVVYHCLCFKQLVAFRSAKAE